MAEKVSGSSWSDLNEQDLISRLNQVGQRTDQKKALVGTLRKNEKEMPPSMLKPAPEVSSQFMYQDDKMILSFNPIKNKKVLMLSSMHQQ